MKKWSAHMLTGVRNMTSKMRTAGTCRPEVGGPACRRGEARGAWRVARIAVVALMAMVFGLAGFVVNVEAVTLDRLPTSDISIGFGTINPGAPGTHFDKVDDPIGSPDNNTTYVESNGNNEVDIFGFSSFALGSSSTINSISVTYSYMDGGDWWNTSASNMSIQVNGTVYHDGTSYDGNATYNEQTATWATNPDTGAAWTVDDVNGIGANPLEGFGFRASNGNNPDPRITQVYITVDYTCTPSTGPISITTGQTLYGNPIDACSIVTDNGATISNITISETTTTPGQSYDNNAADYITATTPDYLGTTGTIEFWISTDDTTSGRPFGFNGDAEVRTSGGGLTFDWGGNNSVSSNSLTAGTWYFFALVYDQNNNNLYLYQGTEGSAPTLVDSDTGWFDSVSGFGTALEIFRSPGNTGEIFDGRISEFRIWNTDRTLADIQADYAAGSLTGGEANLSALWEFNGDATDKAGTEDLTFTGTSGSYSTDVPSNEVGSSSTTELYNNSACSVDTSGWTAGAKDIVVSGTDDCGNPLSDTDTFTFDPTPPGPTVVSGPTPSAVATATHVDSIFHINTVFDEQGSTITGCEVCVSTDGTCDTEWTAATKTGSGATTQCDYDTPAQSNGDSLTINMRATNGNGTGTATPISRTVDAVAPTTTDDEAFGGAWQNNDFTVNLTPADTGSGMVGGSSDTQYCIDINDTCTPSISGTTPATTCGDTNTCTQYIRYRSTDAVGNVEATKSTGAINIDRQVPTVAISNLPATTTGSITGVTVTFSENVTGFADTDITLTSTISAAVSNFSGSGAVYTFDITGMTGDGTIDVDISAAVAVDQAGNNNTAATTASTSYTACTETASVSLDALPDPITGATAITATLGGTGGSAPEVSWDGTTWYASGTTYTPPDQTFRTEDFYARATGSCGGYVYDPSNPTSTTIDSRTPQVEPVSNSAVQSGLTSILAKIIFCGDQNGNATFRVDYKLASAGSWTNGTPLADNDPGDQNAAIETVEVLITGLTIGETYDVRITYIDPDGVNGVSEFLYSVDLVAWTDDPLLHNALRFACDKPGYWDQTSCEGAGGTWTIDRKWATGWGTDSGEYGPILCATCHIKGTTNIKRISTTITASTGSFPGSAVLLTSAEDGTSNFGDDSGGHTTSTKVCEVCHTKTNYHRYDTTAQSGGTAHYNQADCIKCHEHKIGFRASCNACHGNPPLAVNELTATLNPANDTGSNTYGEHDVHVNTEGYTDCNTCHNGWETSGEMPKNGNINIGFITPGTNVGTYDGRSTGGGYTAGTDATVTTGDALTCANYCHGYGTPKWDHLTTNDVVCGSCHGEAGQDLVGGTTDDAGAPIGGTSYTLSGLNEDTKVGKHANHLDNSIEETGDPCALCHFGTLYANSTHLDGSVDVLLRQAERTGDGSTGGAGTSAVYSGGTCSNLACHSDAAWDAGVTGGCNFCHGYPPTSTNNNHAIGMTPVNHDELRSGASTTNTDVSAVHDQCTYCHGFKDGGSGALSHINGPSVMAGAESTTDVNHQDGSVTMNGDGSGNSGTTIDDAGYTAAAGSCASAACHSNDAAHALNSGSTVDLVEIGPGKCDSCHFSGNSVGAPVVTSTSPHVLVTTGGTYGDCTDCHSGHYVSGDGVQIPNNATVGIDYTTTGHGGIMLGGTGTAENINGVATADLPTQTTEAEICWTCHDAQTVVITEWGTNSAQTGSPVATAFDYGTLSTSDWTSATWFSAQHGGGTGLFAYKSGAIQSTHSVNSSGTSAVTATGGYYSESKDNVANIRCSYCHDVHDTYGTNGKPYLRGTWWSNPYKEDGAPTGAWDYYSWTDWYGGVPRGWHNTTLPNNTQLLGGWQIDQNNGNPTSGWTVSGSAGLCLLCHTADGNQNYDQTTGENLWVGSGHSNVVVGGTGAQKSNIYSPSTRFEGTTYTSPKMGYQMNASGGADGDRMYGLRNYDGSTLSTAQSNITADNNAGIAPYAGVGSGSQVRYAYEAGRNSNFTSVWGVDQSTTTAQTKYHNFSCSKCHNPHASRLPKLMITNCLDVSHNTWDDNFSGDPDWTSGEANGTPTNWSTVGIFPTGTETAGNNREFAYAKSAQNCHRFIDNNGDGTINNTDAGGDEPGWNRVTPWK